MLDETKRLRGPRDGPVTIRESAQFVSLAISIVIATVGVGAEVTLDVEHQARSVRPGEVIILEVRSSEPVLGVQASGLSADVRFFSDGHNVLWRGVLGIDLEVSPDDYLVEIQATLDDGNTVRTVYPLAVEAKEFPARHLSVAPSFVNPPSKVLTRIRREAERQNEIFQTSSEERQWSGGFLRPVSGGSTSSFGRRSVFNGEARSPHSGTDFRAAEGAPIMAPNAGTVVLAAELYFSGNAVIIDHGWGLYSYFAHLSSFDVVEGERVERGQVVGKVGATGRVTGPHLHWTVRLNNARVDPLSLLSLFPVP